MTPWLHDCVPVFIYRARLRKGAHYSMSVSSYLLYPIGVASETFPLGVVLKLFSLDLCLHI